MKSLEKTGLQNQTVAADHVHIFLRHQFYFFSVLLKISAKIAALIRSKVILKRLFAYIYPDSFPVDNRREFDGSSVGVVHRLFGKFNVQFFLHFES